MAQTRFQLRIQEGPDVGQTIALESVTITLGRDPMVDLTISDPEVSRQHARLVQTLSGYQIQDLGSTNGTFVDGTRIGGEPVELQPGQTIAIGSSVMMIFEQVEPADELLATVIDFVPPEPDEMAADFAEEAPGDAAEAVAEGIAEDTADVVEAIEEGSAAAEDALGAEFAAPEPEEEIEPAPSELEEQTGAAVDRMDDVIASLPDTPESEAPTEIDFDVPDLEEFAAYEVDEAAVVVPAVAESEQLPPSPPEEPEQIIESVPPAPASTYEPPRKEPPIIPGDGQQPAKRNRTPLIIGGVLLLLLCCCCSFITFMWFIGGDLILQELGLLP